MELLIIFCHLNVRAPTHCSYSTSLDINHVVGKKKKCAHKRDSSNEITAKIIVAAFGNEICII